MDTSVNAANQVVSVGADIAFDADPKFFACLVRFESSSVPTTLPTAYDVYLLYGRHDGGYYTVKDCVTIDVFFSSRRRHTNSYGDWSSDVCSSDLDRAAGYRHGRRLHQGFLPRPQRARQRRHREAGGVLPTRAPDRLGGGATAARVDRHGREDHPG